MYNYIYIYIYTVNRYRSTMIYLRIHPSAPSPHPPIHPFILFFHFISFHVFHSFRSFYFIFFHSMSSHFILFHHFRPFNSVPFHFIHSISFHVIHLIPVYLSFIPSFLYYPLFLHSIIHLFHSIPSGPIPCHALPFHPIPIIHTHSLSLCLYGGLLKWEKLTSSK